MFSRRRKRAEQFQFEWGDLATYNGERTRGIVHTPEWDAKMAEKQEAYYRWLRADYEAQGYEVREIAGGLLLVPLAEG